MEEVFADAGKKFESPHLEKKKEGTYFLFTTEKSKV